MFTRALRSLLFLIISVALLVACSSKTEPTEIPIQQSQPTEEVRPSSVPAEAVLPTEMAVIPTPEEGEEVDPGGIDFQSVRTSDRSLC